LLTELLGSTSERLPLVNISDGGHTDDNCGLYPLFQRQCQVIIVGDASLDTEYSCEQLFSVINQVKIDMNIDVIIDVEDVKPDSEFSASSCAIGKILYPNNNKGWLIYFKMTMTKDVPSTIKAYTKAYHTGFPQRTTTDQSFDEKQFEVHRQLGEFNVKRAFRKLIAHDDDDHVGEEIRKNLQTKGIKDLCEQLFYFNHFNKTSKCI
jgi:hypothetical protein